MGIKCKELRVSGAVCCRVKARGDSVLFMAARGDGGARLDEPRKGGRGRLA